MITEHTKKLTGWDKSYSNTAIFFTILLLVSFLLLFTGEAVDAFWYPVIFGIVFTYFYLLGHFQNKWETLTEPGFTKNLFWCSFVFRLFTSLLLIFIAEITWGLPGYVGAVDALSYHYESLIVADHFRQLEFYQALTTAIEFTGSIDNSGPSLMIGALYAIFGKFYIVSTIFQALLGSYSVLLLYKISRLVWGVEISRLAGIMLMHFPLALFYSVVLMKEGVVVFLTLVIIYVVTQSIRSNEFNSADILLLVGALFSLFFFRVAVGAVCICLIPVAFILNKNKRNYLKSFSIGGIVILVFGFLLFSTGEAEFYLQKLLLSQNYGEGRSEYLSVGSVSLLNISLRDLALTPIYIIVAIIAPFAKMVEVGTYHGTSHDQNYYNMAGSIIWNIMAWFSMTGFYYSIREKFKESFMIWGFTGGYLYILVITVLFTRERFAYIAMPLMLALAAVGIYKCKDKSLWIVYLMGIIFMTLIWNYLRLSVRGI